jgi:hypothetical protein
MTPLSCPREPTATASFFGEQSTPAAVGPAAWPPGAAGVGAPGVGLLLPPTQPALPAPVRDGAADVAAAALGRGAALIGFAAAAVPPAVPAVAAAPAAPVGAAPPAVPVADWPGVTAEGPASGEVAPPSLGGAAAGVDGGAALDVLPGPLWREPHPDAMSSATRPAAASRPFVPLILIVPTVVSPLVKALRSIYEWVAAPMYWSKTASRRHCSGSPTKATRPLCST